MRIPLLIILIALSTGNVKGQISFLSVDSIVQTLKDKTELTYSNSTMEVTFPLIREVTLLQQNNLVEIDSQCVQIMFLKFEGYDKDTKGENLTNQKQLLDSYSKYEIEYFKQELGMDVNPESQWVEANSKGWFIWYFIVGNMQIAVDKKTAIQLYATTIIGDKILILNAPIMEGGDFTKAAVIVNEMMETLIITKQ